VPLISWSFYFRTHFKCFDHCSRTPSGDRRFARNLRYRTLWNFVVYWGFENLSFAFDGGGLVSFIFRVAQ
jgi:hypothetical protein